MAPDALASARLLRDHTTPHTGLRTLVWQQQREGIPVHEALLVGNVAADGTLVSVSSSFLPAVPNAAATATTRRRTDPKPHLNRDQAVAAAARSLESTPLQPESARLRRPARLRAAPGGEAAAAQARLVWLPVAPTETRLCWEVHLLDPVTRVPYQVVVDAEHAEPAAQPWLRRSLVHHVVTPTYRVFTSDSPRPMSPGHPFPAPSEPPPVAPRDLSLIALSTQASPRGWIHEGETRTLGNNVDARTDLRDNNVPYGGPLPPGDLRPQRASLQFTNVTVDLTADPATYREASVVNAFYWGNWAHDRLYGLGFTETAGNFQLDNFGRGGLGGDPMIIEVQNGAALGMRNGGNLIWTPGTSTEDGFSPRLQLYLWDGPEPDRDGALDAEVILHEYVHGMTWRMVGKGVVFSAVQTKALAEGWSDFYALALLGEASDPPDGAYAYGAFSTREWTHLGPPLLENYYFGMRRYPYSTNLTRNPLRFGDVDAARQHRPLAPRSPQFPLDPFDNVDPDPGEPHKAGEVWGAMLWDARANLLAKYGFADGQELVLRLVTDSLNLCGSQNPNFIEAREALLLADRVYTFGANQAELWRAFARRGLGVGAICPPSNTNTGMTESTEVPPASPGSAWTHFTAAEILSSPAVASDGTVIYGAHDRAVRAIRPDGSLKWLTRSTGTPGAFQSSPAIAPDGTVYIGCNDSHLYALDGATGAIRARFKTGAEVFSSPALGPDGSVYFGSVDHHVYALNADFSGGDAPRWAVKTGNTVYSSPAVSEDGWVYIGSSDHRLHALHAGSGVAKPGWPFTTAGPVISSPALAADGTVLFGSMDGRIYAVRPDGTSRWPQPFTTGAPVRSSPAIGPDGTVYVGSQDHRLYAIDGATGTQRWAVATGLWVDASPAVAAGGTIVVGSHDNRVYGITPDGEVLWRFPTLGAVFASPAIGPDGRVYAASAGAGRGNLYALDRGLTAPAASPWPMFRRNSRRTAEPPALVAQR